MQRPIIQKSKIFIQQLFEKELSKDFLFHDLAHTESVRTFSLLIGKENGLSEEDLEIIDIASWFHDAGYTKIYSGHEEASCTIVKQFLEEQNYPSKNIQIILDCILATRTISEPETLLQKIIKDADLNNLGMDSFYNLNMKLRHEWDKICGNQYSDVEWLENTISFLKKHQFYTEEARNIWDQGKQKNLEKIKVLLEVAKEKAAE